MSQLAQLLTEQRNPRTLHIDQLPTLEALRLMHDEDRLAVDSVAPELARIAAAVDAITERLTKGGRLLYIGAGTSGRLGVLDASECPPTFGVSYHLVQGIMAGGYNALYQAADFSGFGDRPQYVRRAAAGGDADQDVLFGEVARVEVSHAGGGVIFGGFGSLVKRVIASRHDALDEVVGDAEGGRALAGIEHAEPSTGAGTDIQQAAAVAESLGDGVHGGRDAGQFGSHTVDGESILLVHQSQRFERG